MNTTAPLRDPLVRDLYWALSSPPLLGRADAAILWPDSGWFHAISLAFQPQLAELDADPQPLRRAEDQAAAGGWLRQGRNTVVVAVAAGVLVEFYV